MSRGVIDEELGMAEYVAGLEKPLQIFRVEPPGAQAVAVHLGLAAQQALRQFNARLLQTDEEDGHLCLNDNVADDIQSKGRLADARPGRNDDELAVMKARRLLIDIQIAGSHAARIELVGVLLTIDAIVG